MNEIMEKSLEKLLKSGEVDYDFEAIIYPNGEIAYARPSHIEAMIAYSKVPKRKIEFEYMPISASPIKWLTGFTNCIPVWGAGFYETYNMTFEQKEMINELVKRKLIRARTLDYIKEGETHILNQDRDKVRFEKLENSFLKCDKCQSVFEINISDHGYTYNNQIRYCPKCGCEVIPDGSKEITDYDRIDEVIKGLFGISTGDNNDE